MSNGQIELSHIAAGKVFSTSVTPRAKFDMKITLLTKKVVLRGSGDQIYLSNSAAGGNFSILYLQIVKFEVEITPKMVNVRHPDECMPEGVRGTNKTRNLWKWSKSDIFNRGDPIDFFSPSGALGGAAAPIAPWIRPCGGH